MRHHCTIISLSLALTATSLAFAQGADGDTRVRAEKLFEEASGLMLKRDFAAACPKFEEVVKLQPQGIGANMTLADCYVGEGKLASAYMALTRAADLATKVNQQDRANAARDRLQSLEPRLSKMFIAVPREIAALEGLSVTRNGVRLTPDELKTASLVDRGAYGIVVTAPGRKRFDKTFTVNDEGTSLTATITLPLEQAKAPPLPSSQEPAADARAASPWSAPRIAGVVMATTGFAMLGAGLGVGAHGVYRINKAVEGSEQAIETNDDVLMEAATKEYDAGQTQSAAGWAVFGVGTAATIAGVILAVAAPDAAENATGNAMIAPWASDSSLGFTVLGQF